MRQGTTTAFEQAVLPLYEATRAEWLAEARAVARKLGRGGTLITIDDVRRVCPPPPEVDPRVCGAVFVRSEWQRLGYIAGSRAQSHCRPVALFRLRGQP